MAKKIAKTSAATAKATEAPAEQPKAKTKREGNIPMMKRLLTEGKTDEEILEAFSERYLQQPSEHKHEADWIQGRVTIYTKIALKDLGGDPRTKKASKKKARKSGRSKKASS